MKTIGIEAGLHVSMRMCIRRIFFSSFMNLSLFYALNFYAGNFILVVVYILKVYQNDIISRANIILIQLTYFSIFSNNVEYK